MNQNTLMPILYLGMISFEQQLFSLYFDYSKTGKQINEQIKNEMRIIGNKEINMLNSEIDARDIKQNVQFKTLYNIRLQEFKHSCTVPNVYYLYPFALPFSFIFPRMATICFGLGFGLQSFLFFNDIIKFKLQSSNLRSNRKVKELMDGSVTLLMVSLGLICGSVITKRGFSNLIRILKEEQALSKELALAKQNAGNHIKQ
ncbi:unnamed protein product (macronuclear) [Paramecium tetraurelia]|uniref:Uncharacterized protein n=1 Tax=Paramecium tetraurelia TaxID=5888 RepID=A0BED5_PARTE|nr:uncharacterized protein GSPATT00027935001 [Paramecium tetraurelia]CAK56902.1 unnamed protein product [Paramecium tetraurelia]|eukprot:XP_001424300.1 hypothetical protein (macronuclear) [Paramecium tetraurelia strain d4-2]